MNIFNKYKEIFLLKLFSVNSLGVVLRSFLGVISQKIIAVYLGPDGIALVGNLKNALAMFGFGSTTGIDQGVIKYQSEFDQDPRKLKKLYGTSVAYSLIGSVFVALILFLGAENWSNYLFNRPDFGYLFMILALTMPFTALYNLSLAVINGKSDYKKATIVTFTTYALVTLLIILLVIFYSLSGALLAIILTPIAQLTTLVIFARSEAHLFVGLKVRFYKIFRSELFLFILMAFVAVVFNNVVELQLRNHLIKKLSIDEAGYWTSMLSFSNYYLSFMTGVYSLYVLPKYAKIKKLEAFVKEVKYIYKTILPIFALMFLIIFALRETLIRLLYTREFLPMEVLFKWQLLGDMVKIMAVIIAYQFIAQKLWKVFIITEIISLIMLYAFAVYFVGTMGVEGITFAHLLRYIVYLAIVIFAVRRFFKNKRPHEES